MKQIRVESLIPDATITEPLYLDEKYILLSPDTPVDQPLIERLKKWNFNHVYSDGVAVGRSEITSNPEHETVGITIDEDIRQKSDNQQITRFYFDLLSFTKDFFFQYMNKNELNMGLLTDKIKVVMEQVKKHRDLILRFNEMKYPTDNYLYNHSVNATLLALAIGNILKLPPHKMIELGIAAMLHDIGMLRIPPALYLGNKPLTPVEKKTIMAHTIAGYKALKNFSVPENIALPALEHHERIDGSGYPRILKGEQISPYSKIIAIACTFDGITADRPYKDCMDGHHGLIDLLKNNKGKYDENVLKALIFSISLYPVGTFVLLSNNSKGIVVKTNPHNPKCPIVRILVDKKGSYMTEQVLLQTSEESGITVFRALEENERPKIEEPEPEA